MRDREGTQPKQCCCPKQLCNYCSAATLHFTVCHLHDVWCQNVCRRRGTSGGPLVQHKGASGLRMMSFCLQFGFGKMEGVLSSERWDDRGENKKKWGRETGDDQAEAGKTGCEEFRSVPGWGHLGFNLGQEGKGKPVESPPPPEVSCRRRTQKKKDTDYRCCVFICIFTRVGRLWDEAKIMCVSIHCQWSDVLKIHMQQLMMRYDSHPDHYLVRFNTMCLDSSEDWSDAAQRVWSFQWFIQ